MIAELSQQKRLKNIQFDQAEVKFKFARRILHLVELIIHSHKIIITTRGTNDFARGQDMDLMIGLNFHRDLVEDIKFKELRYAFEPSKIKDGYRVFNFKVWGKPSDPESDFAERLAKKGAEQWLKHKLIETYQKEEEERERKSKEKRPEEELIEQGLDAIFQLFEK